MKSFKFNMALFALCLTVIIPVTTGCTKENNKTAKDKVVETVAPTTTAEAKEIKKTEEPAKASKTPIPETTEEPLFQTEINVTKDTLYDGVPYGTTALIDLNNDNKVDTISVKAYDYTGALITPRQGYPDIFKIIVNEGKSNKAEYEIEADSSHLNEPLCFIDLDSSDEFMEIIFTTPPESGGDKSNFILRYNNNKLELVDSFMGDIEYNTIKDNCMTICFTEDALSTIWPEAKVDFSANGIDIKEQWCYYDIGLDDHSYTLKMKNINKFIAYSKPDTSSEKIEIKAGYDIEPKKIRIFSFIATGYRKDPIKSYDCEWTEISYDNGKTAYVCMPDYRNKDDGAEIIDPVKVFGSGYFSG